jgi:GWxTD domain-containing protein
VTIYGADGLPVDSSNTYFSVRVDSATEAVQPGYRVFNRLSVLLSPGIYAAHLTVIDAVSKNEGRFFIDRVIVAPPRRDKIAIGGEGLAYLIKYVGDAGTEDRNVLNGLYVLPNPIHVFSTADTIVYLYAELYNLDYSEGDTSAYRVDYLVLDYTGSTYRDYGHVIRRKAGPTAVLADDFDVTGWPAGEYRFEIVASDLSTLGADTSVLFMRIVPEYAETFDPVASEVFDPYDTLSLEDRQNMTYWLLEPNQQTTLEHLAPEGKENFLRQYWLEHDSDPTTALIENRLLMIERYEFCNRFFSTNEDKDNGWRSDRGRIYMTYGPWDERDDIQAPLVGSPYVVWFYHQVREGAIFVFEDKRGFHDYQLVHSNMEGERFSKEWEDRLETEIYRFK